MPSRDQLRDIVRSVGFDVLAEEHLSSRAALMVRPPSVLRAEISSHLDETFPRGLYKHQATAIEAALNGADICLATPTASGKSLAFIAIAAHMLADDPDARVLALYPAKALIRDQLAKWTDGLRQYSLTPAFIDGGVPLKGRNHILSQHRVVLMTPDVAHAWLMSRASEPTISAFLSNLKLLILDEAHVYDGVFGTNAAYLIRRLLAKSAIERIISSTATIGKPREFIEMLTGREPVVIGEDDDGSPHPGKTLSLVRRTSGNALEAAVVLMRTLAQTTGSRFIAFADSRKQVEHLVAIAHREAESDQDDADVISEPANLFEKGILPYRSGYEEEDRRKIQDALTSGALRGVVSTSALELGLDIGEVDVVILVDSPPTVKSFWQRLGRAGRRGEGFCILIDDRGTISAYPGGLSAYIRREPETSWLYLDNQFVQYSQALCTAHENPSLPEGSRQRQVLSSLPERFLNMVDNEINPTESIPQDLYPLKQRAQAGAHYEFPLRSSIEKSFGLKQHLGPATQNFGSVTLSQMLREAYPGAIYYYMATPYRVQQLKYRAGEITIRRERRWTTQPLLQNKVFPQLPAGVLNWRASERGFITEAELQVSERVIGFVEKRGPNRTQYTYGLGSPYSQKPIDRSFETTGVCWYFTQPLVLTEAIGEAMLQAFCSLCGIEKRDVGVGSFRAKVSAIWGEECDGVCVYDSVVGSLRLTRQLYERFPEVLEYSVRLLEQLESPNEVLQKAVGALSALARDTLPQRAPEAPEPQESGSLSEGDWILVIAPSQPALLSEGGVFREVQVAEARYTPRGLMYHVPSERKGNLHLVRADLLRPINGLTKLVEMNLMTGEIRPRAAVVTAPIEA